MTHSAVRPSSITKNLQWYHFITRDGIILALKLSVTDDGLKAETSLTVNFSVERWLFSGRYVNFVFQTSTGMFGLGNSQTKRTKSYSTSPLGDMTRLNPLRVARLVWINNRTVTLMLADGSETRFNVWDNVCVFLYMAAPLFFSIIIIKCKLLQWIGFPLTFIYSY